MTKDLIFEMMVGPFCMLLAFMSLIFFMMLKRMKWFLSGRNKALNQLWYNSGIHFSKLLIVATFLISLVQLVFYLSGGTAPILLVLMLQIVAMVVCVISTEQNMSRKLWEEDYVDKL